MSDARKEQRLRACDAFGSGSTLRFRSEPLQGSLDRGDIACAVIQQGNFHSKPLVLGSTRRNLLSRATAKRRARAKALNMASTR